MAKRQLETPVLAVDVVVLRVVEARLEVLLHRRRDSPFRGKLALPGVAVETDELLETAARRALSDKGRLSEQEDSLLHLEQLATFDALFRDPRGRTVSVAYLGLVRHLPSRAVWYAVEEVPRGTLPFDHDQIVAAAVERLRGKLRYTTIAGHLLPEPFRMDELQRVYEAILGQPLNRANFRTKLLKLGLLERVGVLAAAVGSKGGRPPHVYRFSAEPSAWQGDFLR